MLFVSTLDKLSWKIPEKIAWLTRWHSVKSVLRRIFLVFIFSHSDLIRGDTECLFVFSPNADKYGPEIIRIRTLFKQADRFFQVLLSTDSSKFIVINFNGQ